MTNKIIQFKTEAEMLYKSPNVDPNHWANKAQTRLLKKKVFENTDQTVVYCPAFLDGKKYTCPNCQTKFEPDWLAKRQPILPYMSNDGLIIKMRHALESCSNCKHEVEIDIPYVPHVCLRKLYGDEAIRFVEEKVILSYTFIGEPLDKNVKEQLYRDFLKLKNEIVDSIPPTSWIFHFTELWSKNKREERKYSSNLSREDIIEFSSKLGDLLKKYEKEIDIFNATGIFEKPEKYKKEEEQLLKSRVYYPLIFNCIHSHTVNGYSPHMFFEKTGNDGWAKNLFKGGMLTLAWPFITNSNPIPEPEFVSPKHDFLLEIADFVSFVVARYLYQIGLKSLGKDVDIDIDPSVLGWVHYTGFRNDSGAINYHHNKYPLKEFLSGTSWVEN